MLLRDLLRGEDDQLLAIAAIVARVDPDILVLTDFDYDARGAALDAFADALAARGSDLGYPFALRPNSGLATGMDMDGDGRTGDGRDAQGFGRFAGDGGMAILSKLPIDPSASRDLSAMLWRDLPGATMPTVGETPYPSAEAQAIQRLSTTGHWVVRVTPAGAEPFDILASSATPPVFDGPEDMNGLRNRDELRLWELLIGGALGPPPARFIVAGNLNLDPQDGEGHRGAMARFLANPALTDPAPASEGGRVAADPGQAGDPALDTADWPDNAPGNLRVSYILPAVTWTVTGSGVFWPAPGQDGAELLGADGQRAGPHRLVWVDIAR